MKTPFAVLHAAAICLICCGALAAEPARKAHAGPNGGRNLPGYPHPEFLIGKDRSVTVRFYAHEGEKVKAVPPAGQSLTVSAITKDGRSTVEFEKKGDALVSKTKLPKGDGYDLMVQYRKAPDAEPQHTEFKMSLKKCSQCKLAQYACVCDQ